MIYSDLIDDIKSADYVLFGLGKEIYSSDDTEIYDNLKKLFASMEHVNYFIVSTDKAGTIRNCGLNERRIVCPVNEKMAESRIKILSSEVIDKVKSLEEEDVLVVAGRGVRNEKDVEMCRELAEALGGQLAFTRPMVENGFGDTAHQIGLSGRTVRPKLIITCGVSGAIQFTSCMNGSECIVAINTDPQAQIFGVADYCIVDDLYQVVPELTALAKKQKED